MNVDHNASSKSLTVDLGDIKDLTSVLIKASHLKSPLAVPLKNGTADLSVVTQACGDKNFEVNAPGNENSQTNSGIINRSQFNDGGFGDIGQQWSRVKLCKSTIINNHTSINLTLGGNENKVCIDKNTFGNGQTASGDKNKNQKCKKCKK